jgi:adenylate cyclase
MRAPEDEGCLIIKVAVEVSRGQLDAARATMGLLRSASPKFSLAVEREYRRFGNSPLMERFLADLARANAPATA